VSWHTEKPTVIEPRSALEIASSQLQWYRRRKTRNRIGARLVELSALGISLLVAIAGALAWDSLVPAVAGAVLVLLAGIREVFNWREGWLAFVAAEAELERAIDYYHAGIPPYDGADRDERLIRRTWEVRTTETSEWRSRQVARTPEPDALGRDAVPDGQDGGQA
jgi:uncharacterized protein DUF4231